MDIYETLQDCMEENVEICDCQWQTCDADENTMPVWAIVLIVILVLIVLCYCCSIDWDRVGHSSSCACCSCCSSDDSSSSSVTDNVTARMGGATIVFDQISVVEFPYVDGGQSFVNLEVEASASSDPSKILRFEIDQGLVGVNEMLVLSYEDSGVKYDYAFNQDAADTATLASNVLENSNSSIDHSSIKEHS